MRIKRMLALVLTLSLVIGMLSVIGTFLSAVAVEGEQPIRFSADFTELQKILEQNGLGNTYNCGSDAYQTAYTAKGDVSTADGQLNTWMREHFASKTSHTATAKRAWFSQGDFLLQGNDSYNGNSHFSVSGGMLRHQLAGGAYVGEMLRRVNTLIPQYKGTDVRLKNFEARLTFKLGMANFKGGFVFNFHETDAGAFATTSGFTHKHTGNTLVIGNGAGHGAAGMDGWAFHDYDANNPCISATTVDTATNLANDVAVMDGVRFDRTLDDQLYMLMVRVVNGKATFTLESADGAFSQTLTNQTFSTEDGFISFGVSNRDTQFQKLEITELDGNGNAVDFGTYHDSVEGVETFEESFSNLPDLHWNGSAYTYDSANTSYSDVNGTAALTSAATYKVDVKSAALVDRLESKFDFYVYANGGGGIMERWNVAGYMVDANGNNLASGWVNSGVTSYIPALGTAGGDWMPGCGRGGYSYQYPTITLSENKWLKLMPDWGANGAVPFDVTSYFTVQNTDGSAAVLKNFKLDLDFKLTTPGATTYNNNQSPVFVKFGGYEGVTSGCTDGAMFAIAYNGGYFLDDLSTTYTSGFGWNGSAYAENVTFAANTFTKNNTSSVLNFPSYAGAEIGGGEMHLTLTVKNGVVNAKITNASGNTVLDVTKDDIAIQNGAISIGTTYAGIYHGMPLFGAVKVTRLDDSGEPIDFTAEEDGFSAAFMGLTDYYDGKYYRNNGNKAKSVTSGTVPLSNAWLGNATAGQYAFNENDTGIVNYLNDRFDFYHTDLTGTTTKLDAPYIGSQEVQADQFVPGNVHWELQGGRWLRCFFGRAGANELFRKYMTIVPKEDGNVIYAADFEASFDIAQHSAPNTASSKTGGAIAFTFRSKEIAKLQNAVKSYADATTLVFTRNELVIYDGVTADYKWTDLESSANRTAWSGGSVGTARVTLKVVKNKMDLKVTSLDGAVIYYETVGKTLSYNDAAGYMYFTVLNSDGAVADINITPLMRTNVAAPTGLVGGIGKITGLSAGASYEYKLTSADEWTTVPAGNTMLTGMAAGTYEVRFAGSKYSEASAATTVKVRTSNIDDGYTGEVDRFEADFAQLTVAVNTFDAEGYYVPTADDTAINEYLDTRFALYYNNQATSVQRDYAGQSSAEFENDSWGGVSLWRVNTDGVLQRHGNKLGGEMLRKIEMLTLKAPNGNYAKLQNFEATYTVVDNLHQKGAVTLSFRSAVNDRIAYVKDNRIVLVYPEQETVIIGVDHEGKHGISFGSGDDHGETEKDTYRYLQQEIAALANVNEYIVTVRVVGSEMTVRIANTDNETIWENTNEPVTLKRTETGYMSFGISNGDKGFKSIVVTQLDANGDAVDFGIGTRASADHYDSENTVYYDFSDAAQEDDFDGWFLPEQNTIRKPLVSTTGTSDANWYVSGGALRFRQNSLFRSAEQLAAGFEMNGTDWQHDSFMTAYSANMGIAVLNTKQYKNFILDYDFTGTGLWTQVGFGADNTENGVYWTTVDGGYTFTLEYDGGKGASDFWYQTEDGASRTREAGWFVYNASGTHHMQIIVSDGKAYMSVDYQEPWEVSLPETYEGGYIYFAANNTAAAVDNLKITDLDVKAIVLDDVVDIFEDIEIDRKAGESISFPAVGYGKDANGYEYPMYLTFANDTYRSYKDGTFAFKIGMQPLYNLTLSSGYQGTVTVKNNINGDYDTTASRKYYFDHPNDFLDFEAYSSEYQPRENYWSVNDPDRDMYWTAFDGNLIKGDNTENYWNINADGSISPDLINTQVGWSPVTRLSQFYTLMLKDVNLLNFRLEADVLQEKAGANHRYNYLILGVQDPTQMYAKLSKYSASLSTGHETGFLKDEDTAKGGVWTFMEREGYFNIAGNLDGGLYERITEEPTGYDFLLDYKPGEWHHVVIEVKEGVMSLQVDDSMKFYFYLDNNAIGGLVGLASHTSMGSFDNFQLTALDANGTEVPFEEAARGWAEQDTEQVAYFGWNTERKKWKFDWSKLHKD